MNAKLVGKVFRFVFIFVFMMGVLGAPGHSAKAQTDTGAIAGTIQDTAGNPIGGASICSYNRFGEPTCTNSGLDGSYVLSGLAVGEYRVFTTANGWGSQVYPSRYLWDEYQPVAVQAGQTTGQIHFHLVPGGHISGTVYAADGTTPLPYVSVNLVSTGHFQGTCTDENGHYNFNGVPFEVAWHVRESGNPASCWGASETYVSEYWPGVYSLNDAAVLVLDASHPAQGGIDFSIELGTNPFYNVRATTDQVEAFGWPMGDHLTLMVDRPSTGQQPDYETTDTISGTASWDPNLTSLSFDLSGKYDIQAGDLVTVKNQKISKSHLVSNLNINDADLGNDTVVGTAGPYQIVNTWTCWQNDPCVSRLVRADGTGHWSATFAVPGPNDWEQGIADLRPGSWIDSSLEDPDGNTTMYGWSVPNPRFDAWYRDDSINAYDWPLGTQLTLQIDDLATADKSPDFSTSTIVRAAPWNSNQTLGEFHLNGAFDIQPGMTLTVSGGSVTKQLLVSNLAITSVDPATDVITGTAEPGRSMWMNFDNSSGSCCRDLKSDDDGAWAVDYWRLGPNGEQTEDIRPGSSGTINVLDDDGDNTSLSWGVPNPRIEVLEYADRIALIDWPAGQTVHVTIGDPASADHEQDFTPDRDLSYYEFFTTYDIKIGDLITATNGIITKTLEVAVLKATEVDRFTGAVHGIAAPDSQFDVDVWGDHFNAPPYHYAVTVDENGIWSGNYGDIPGSLLPWTWAIHGEMRQSDEDGDVTIAHWHNHWGVLEVWMEEAELRAFDWDLGTMLTFTVDDPTTDQPADFTESVQTTPLTWMDHGQAIVSLAGKFELRPGMIVSVTDGVKTKSTVIQNIGFTKLDAEHDVVTGFAPANAALELIINKEYWSQRYITADGNGNWLVDYHTPDVAGRILDLQTGDHIDGLLIRDGDVDSTVVSGHVPSFTLHAVPAYPEVHGHDWLAGTSITLILDNDRDPSNGVLYTRTKNVDDDSWCGYPCFDLADAFDLQVGQYVTMMDGTATKTVQVSVLKITEVDRENDRISGIADPGSRVAVNIWSQDGKARYVTTDANGNWVADFSVIGDEDFEQFTTDIRYGDNGRAIQLNPDGSDDGTLEYWDVDWVAPPSMPVVYALSQPIDLGLSNLVVESLDVVGTLQDSLFRLDSNGNLQPLAAMDYSVSADGLVYTVHLRPGAVWSDGQPVTAQNFVDGILRILDPSVHSGYGLLFYPIKNAEAFSNDNMDRSEVGVQATDTLTLQITLERPTSHFAQILASPATLPVRQDLIDQYGDIWTSPAHYVSSGPYILAEYDSAHIILEKNSQYKGPMKGDFEQIGFDVIPDTDAQIAAYKNGDVDVLLSVPILKIMGDPELRRDLTVLSSPGIQYLGLSTQVYPTNNPLVRKALASAIDRQAILHDVLQTPWRVEATGVIPPEMAGYQGSSVGYSYNPTQAQAYLAQAGYPGGQGFPVLHFTASLNQGPVMQAIADQWHSVLGINVEVNILTGQPRQEIMNGCRANPQTCTYHGYTMGWVVDYPDEYNILNDLFNPDSFVNYTQWDNTVYRSVIQQASSELDPAQRTAYWQQAEKILVEDDAVVAPIYFLDSALVVRPGIHPYYAPTYFTNLAYWSNADRSGDGLAVEVIGSSGGTVATESNTLSVDVPPAALQSDVNLSVTDLGGNYQVTASQDELDVLESFSIQPHGLQFATPVTLSFAWDDSNNDGIVDGTSKLESNIFLLKDGNQIAPACGVNPDCDMHVNVLTVQVSSLSHFELVAPVNEPPANVAITAPTAPQPVNQLISIQVGFSDVDDSNAHVVSVDWGDGVISSASTSDLNAVASHSYQSAGVCTLKVTITDSAGASAQAVYQYVVIYDPNGGFVTGSGWINSPAGAYTKDSTLSGKATFGFVSKYLKGANIPTGSTEFQFKVGNLNFKSTSYDWLVIAGTKAQYKGTGMINGAGNYGFLLTAIDGSPDKFRIKIWDKSIGTLIYDNMLGAAEDAIPITALEGGSIVIHKDK